MRTVRAQRRSVSGAQWLRVEIRRSVPPVRVGFDLQRRRAVAQQRSDPPAGLDRALPDRGARLGHHAQSAPQERRDREVAATLIDRLGIEDIAMRNVGSLSGGQRQKVILARALAQEPRGLVLDEPTSDLDIRHELEVLSLLREEAPNGLAVVHAMHDLTLAARYSDHVVLISDGGVYAQGSPEVLTADAISEVYGIDVSVHDTPDGPAIVPLG
ncbi:MULTISPECIES: ABC transporter ATP-binding protein [Salinibaculum]|uniref:ABC transporter ATP-binding protein n=1 Tax=Salinibaculum TaxID=2732368 RepID=UPI0030CFC280